MTSQEVPAEIRLSSEVVEFATDAAGRKTFSGTLMLGSKVLERPFLGKALFTPKMFSGADGKTVPLMLQHQKVPSVWCRPIIRNG